MSDLRALERERARILEEIRGVGDMRRGCLIERYLPCGKPGCHCGKPDSKGHGPKYSLTFKVKGRTKTEYIAPEEVGQVREQVQAHVRFLELCKRLVEVNEQLCRLRLEAGQESVAKKNSAKSFRRRSGVRSGG